MLINLRMYACVCTLMCVHSIALCLSIKNEKRHNEKSFETRIRMQFINTV